MTRMTLADLQTDLGLSSALPGFGTAFGPRTKAAFLARLTNLHAPGMTVAELQAAADRLGVPVGHIRGVRKIEAPRGAFDDQGRPSILYERHKFHAATDPVGRFDARHPDLSSPHGYGPGGYGSFASQYDKLCAAAALDVQAALEACSWGAFQVLGSNADPLGYGNAWNMAKALTASEAAHLDCFMRYVEHYGLADEFRACRPNDPASCVPFVSRYNGSGYAEFRYHIKLAAAIA